MDPAALIVLTIAVTIEFVVGIALNMSILLVYIGNLKNGLSLGPSDKVHLTKALVNVFLLVMMTALCTIFTLWPHLFFMNEVFLWITMINMFLNFYGYWLTALLCVYYCTNITNCAHHIFVRLKRSLSSYLLHILLVSGLGSFAISCPIFWFCGINPAGNSTYESTAIPETFFLDVTYKTLSTIVGCFLPFTIAFASTTFTSWSLINHMWRMKKNNWGFTPSKFQTQINATRTMILFLLISVIYNVTQMFFITLPFSSPSAVAILFWLVFISYPISEAIIIIQSSFKLRNILLVKFFNRKRRNDEAET